jgi:hypothetical protein
MGGIHSVDLAKRDPRARGLARPVAAWNLSEMSPILQKSLPEAPWLAAHTARLPGVQPLDRGDWLRVDDAFAAQMAERDRLLASRRDDVTAGDLDGPAAREVLALILDALGPGYTQNGDRVQRPDGVTIDPAADAPLVSAARLVQEDLCLLEPDGQGEHRLTAAVLCFPASWTLREKIGRPMTAIHGPVDSYTPDMARRVQRLFDAIRPECPLWRQNALLYADPALYHPRSEHAPRDDSARETPYLRSERQCLLRLPETGAVLFSIHTYVLATSDLSPAQRAGLTQLETAS